MAKRRSVKGKKPTQQDLPGTVPRKIAKVHAAAISYAEARDDRIESGRQEIAAREELRAQMHKHHLDKYAANGVSVTLSPRTEQIQVKVRKPGDDDEDRDLGDDTEAAEAQASLNGVSVE